MGDLEAENKKLQDSFSHAQQQRAEKAKYRERCAHYQKKASDLQERLEKTQNSARDEQVAYTSTVSTGKEGQVPGLSPHGGRSLEGLPWDKRWNRIIPYLTSWNSVRDDAQLNSCSYIRHMPFGVDGWGVAHAV